MSYNKQYIADGKKSGKAPEKKNFTQACNILNQYIKEKGSLRDLNITEKLDSIGNNNLRPFNYVTGRQEISQSTTVDFLSNMENPYPAPAVRISSPPEKSLPPLPQFIDVESFLAGQASSSKPTTVEAQTAAMTIIYGGQVMVFNDFSEEKVGEIMSLANKSTTGGDRVDRGKAPLTSPSISASIFGSQEQPRQAINVEANGSDLPIARRASLHKFLAKRKDRAAARAAPYEVATSSRKDEPLFDLNF